MIERAKMEQLRTPDTRRVTPVAPTTAREEWRDRPIASVPVVRPGTAITPSALIHPSSAIYATDATTAFITQMIAQYVKPEGARAFDMRGLAYEPRPGMKPLYEAFI